MGDEKIGRGRATRLLSRALVVLGGTVAATAAAWLITSATAAADTGQPGLPDAVAAPGIAAPLQPAVSGVLGAVAGPAAVLGPNTVESIPVESIPVESIPVELAPAAGEQAIGLPQVTGQLGAAVARLGHLDGGSGRGATGIELPTGGFGHAGPVRTPVGIAPAPGTHEIGQPISAAQPQSLVNPAGRSASAGAQGRHRQAGGGSGSPELPAPHPFGPPTAPVSSGANGGVSGPQGPTAPSLVDAAGSPAIPGLDVVRVLTPTDAPGSPLPGKQPGSTPD